jgi:acetyl esterase/lipase
MLGLGRRLSSMPFGHFVPAAWRRQHGESFHRSDAALLLAGVCVLPARPTAADGQEKKQGATRPAISQEVAPLEAIVPVAKDGHKGEAYVRKPPGKGPFPAVVLIHGDIVRWPTTQLKEYALGAWSSRYLAAGYVVAVTTYRSRDVDPQTRESPDDVLATVEYVRKLSYVDPKSIVVNGTSGGGDLALTVATETDVAGPRRRFSRRISAPRCRSSVGPKRSARA